MTLPTLTDIRNWAHSAAAIVGWLSLVFGLVQVATSSLSHTSAAYGQWMAGIGGGLVLLSKGIDSLNNALGGTPAVAAAAAPVLVPASNPNV